MSKELKGKNGKEMSFDDDMGFSEEEQALLDQHGDDNKTTEQARLRMKNGKLEFVRGDEVSRHNDGIEMIVLDIFPPLQNRDGERTIIREYNPHEYNPKNPKPATCFSVDGITPHEEAIKPIVLNRNTGNREEVTSCGSCPGKFGTKKCTYKRQVTACLTDDQSPQSMFTCTVPAVSLFHKGDLLDNPCAERLTGLDGYARRVGSLTTTAGKAVSSLRLVTTVKVFDQTEQSTAMAFSFHQDGCGNKNLTTKEQVVGAMSLVKEGHVERMRTSYIDHLVAGVRSLKKEDEESATDTTQEAAPETLDELDDLEK